MGVLSKLNRARKKATKKVLNPFVKGISKISDKFIPNELRWAMPYAAGIGTLMLPPGMGPLYRALAASGMNIAGQIAADETPIGFISSPILFPSSSFTGFICPGFPCTALG